MTMGSAEIEKPKSALDRIFNSDVNIKAETLLCVLLVILAIFTRFYDLESRVMSHDESLHTYYSWRFLEYQDYKHLPMMHGPLQFHLVGFSYFLFGDSDASSRYPAAILGVVSVVLIFAFRKWLGRWGTVFGAALMVFSPYMLYYQRYVRNEALVVFEALLMFWAIFSYFETRQSKWLYLLSFSLILHYATKETSFIYGLQLMLFLGVFLSWDILRRSWNKPDRKFLFVMGLLATIVGVSIVGYALLGDTSGVLQDPTIPGQPLDPSATGLIDQTGGVSRILALGGIFGLVGVLFMFIILVLEFGKKLRTEFPVLDLLVITVTMTMPLLAAVPAKILNFEPLPQNTSVFNTPTGIIVVLLMLASLAIGLIWDWRRWIIAAAVFYGPFVILYTSLFTNGHGLSSGLVSSLEYWIGQHGEKRGGQPWYYYLLVQIPIYEYLPAIGSFVAVGFGLGALTKRVKQDDDGILLVLGRSAWYILGQIVAISVYLFNLIFNFLSRRSPDESNAKQRLEIGALETFPFVLFLAYWGLTSLFAYSFAGERMPWLAVHITLPLILLAGWGFGKWVESVDWGMLKSSRGWIAFGLILITYFSFMKALGILTGSEPPFQGNEQETLAQTTAFLAALAIGMGGLVALYCTFQNSRLKHIFNLGMAVILGTLFVLTIRTSFRAAYQDYDQATEYLVYAHSATGVKTILAQVEEYSRRTTGELAVDVAYDDDVSWPYTWYLRNYTNKHYFGASPSRDIANYPLVIAGGSNWAKVDPLIGRKYLTFEYVRMWWPMQDYFGLTWERIRQVFTDRDLRRALWDIWLDRDYTAYGLITGKDFSLENWSPSDRMKFYIRKDVATTLWDYGVVAAASPELSYTDPYADGIVVLQSEKVIGQAGTAPSEFSSPRSIAFSEDGWLYVADSRNHRIQYFDANGVFLGEWGRFADSAQGDAPPGTFNEPWGISVAPDGTIYVADTWNHRVQHFTAEGEFIDSFGHFGQGYEADTFWGPRAVVVDDQGRIFVVDTGNKRVAVLDQAGNLVGQFGGTDIGLGQLNEPMGIALDDQGLIYIADSWNQRVVVFEDAGEGVFRAIREWLIDGWWGESLENKPYLAISASGQVCVSDPEGYRILCFSSEGNFILGWGDFGYDFTTFDLPSGLAFSPDGHLWVSDSGNSRLMRFKPELE